jgi:hypothetical protein
MTGAAQQAVIFEAAFATAIRHGNDVIRFPARAQGAPRLSRGAITGGRLRACPLAMRLHDVEAAELAGALVSLPDLLADVRRAAANLPLVYALVTAERAARRLHEPSAPAAHRLAGRVAVRNSPLIGGDNARAAGAHA